MKQDIQQSRLFSEQELDNIDGNLFAEREQSGPVICLGMEFENDEARREYFRAELRKLLPTLRHIEGFPIGEDDDIIALSDPPYYTACPNPWLNDFISQWEAEKADLKARGLRSSDFEVKEPYAADVSEGKNNPVYVAHTYHTKVPHPAIMRYILHYTQPGDIVFDGFAGTGMTGVAATNCGNKSEIINYGLKSNRIGFRHAITTDLSPFASQIAYNYCTPCNTDAIKKEASRILAELKREWGWMYDASENGIRQGEVKYIVWTDNFICNHCGQEFNYWDNAIDFNGKKLNDSFPCPHCGSLVSKKCEKSKETIFDKSLEEVVSIAKITPAYIVYVDGKGKRHQRLAVKDDFDIIKKIEEVEIDSFTAAIRMPEGDEARRNDKDGRTHAHHFYTKRNLIVLSQFYKKIFESPNAAKLLFLFTGLITRSTIRNRLGINYFFNGGGGWNLSALSGTLYIGSLCIECSVLDLIENRIDVFDSVGGLLPRNYTNAVAVESATSLNIADNQIDYIFVDPPFGANIMYSELSFLYEAWLKVITNTTTEAIVNKTQHKTLFEYQTLMNRSLNEFYRILKPGKWLTMEFSNTSAAVWNSIQNALQGVGFVITNVSALDKQQGSFKAVTTTTAVKQDLIITCYKPTAELTYKFQSSSDTAANVWDFVSELLEHLPVHVVKEQKTTTIVERSPKILFDRLIAYYVQHGYPVPMNAQEFQKGLRDRFIELDGMFFTAPQAAEYKEKKREAPEMLPMGLIVSDEANGIEWLKLELKTPQTYQEIQPKWLQAVGAVRKNDIIPELRQLLEENFIEEANGKWRLPNIQDDKDVAALRTKALMREFKLYVEQASKPKGKIKEARVEALRAGFKQCYIDKDFKTIVMVGDRIPANLRDEDEVLLQFYDIALNKI